MATKSSTAKTATSNSKKTTATKPSSGTTKKGAVNVKVPTARDRAKDMDEGRRSDANSNGKSKERRSN